MYLSVVTSTYNSSGHIKEFINRIKKTLEKENIEYEIIIVDDGSEDNSIQTIKEVKSYINNIKLIELSRNFGQHPALICGLNHARGEFIYMLDSDLEEEPELYHIFKDELLEKDLDLVFGQSASRRGNILEKLSGNFYYFFLKHLFGFYQPNNLATIRLMRRTYLDAYLLYKEHVIQIGAITEIAGFKKKGIFINKLRLRKSNYSWIKKFQVLVRSITNYSSRPLYFLFYSGIFISFISFSILIYFVIRSFLIETTVPGWLTLVCLSWLGVGITILSNGIIAIYLKTIFLEVKERPRTIIRRIYD